MGPGVAQEGWNTRKWGYLWGRYAFPGFSLPQLPAPGLACVDEPHLAGQDGEAGKWASASKQPHYNGPLIYGGMHRPQGQPA